MKFTALQKYVLANLERVEINPYKLNVQTPFSRWQLDGKDCTNQISALLARDVVIKHPTLGLARTADLPRIEKALALRQQSWSPKVVDMIRKSMMTPTSVHRDRRSMAL